MELPVTHRGEWSGVGVVGGDNSALNTAAAVTVRSARKLEPSKDGSVSKFGADAMSVNVASAMSSSVASVAAQNGAESGCVATSATINVAGAHVASSRGHGGAAVDGGGHGDGPFPDAIGHDHGGSVHEDVDSKMYSTAVLLARSVFFQF